VAVKYAPLCINEDAMRLVPTLSWSAGSVSPTPVEPRLFDLLARIEAQGSLRAAADAIGMPYRTAWGLLQDMERTFGSPLVRLQRGRGASLTVDGAAMLRADEAARRRLSRHFAALAREIGAPAARTRGGAAPVLRIAASHDLALAELKDALPVAAGARLDVDFCGSIAALARFRAGEVDIAGFHFVPGHPETARPFLRHLRASCDRLVRFVDRDQGLIVARANPRRVRCLADVIDRKLRFVNRQAGSGTRLLIDAQLAGEGRTARELRGYANEEFTHAAVAATIASGHADVGFGVAAAAAEYDLVFVPVVRERYYFAVREAMLHSPAIVALRDALAGPVFMGIVGHMVGYDATHSGSLERVGGLGCTAGMQRA
jgi:molybdate transport repressor ModE-like protein